MIEHQFPVHRDERGELVVVEGEKVDFAVQRVFTVSGADGAPSRGGHVADCTELVVLVCGSAVFHVRRSGSPESVHHLEKPGQSLTLGPEDHLDYDLGGKNSVIMVLCDEPYRRQA